MVVYPKDIRYASDIFGIYMGAAVKVVVSRWGNSLGLRIPKYIAERAGLGAGTAVELEARGDRVVISPARPHYKLERLLKDMSPKSMRDAFDWGPDRGRETVD